MKQQGGETAERQGVLNGAGGVVQHTQQQPKQTDSSQRKEKKRRACVRACAPAWSVCLGGGGGAKKDTTKERRGIAQPNLQVYAFVTAQLVLSVLIPYSAAWLFFELES